MITIELLPSILFLGVSETTIAPVVLTVEGEKLTLQATKVPGVSVIDELVEEADTSVPIAIMKGLVVMAG